VHPAGELITSNARGLVVLLVSIAGKLRPSRRLQLLGARGFATGGVHVRTVRIVNPPANATLLAF